MSEGITLWRGLLTNGNKEGEEGKTEPDVRRLHLEEQSVASDLGREGKKDGRVKSDDDGGGF